ncbi:MAG: hypothetical protein NTZ61_01755, partial [Proteobacteria bacterium]|nr:hypothetical protein [Pseudomonadota bacterium]
MNARHVLCLASLIAGLLAGCGDRQAERAVAPSAGVEGGAAAQGNTAPTPFTETSNAAVANALPLADPQDFEDAQRGLVASDPDFVVKNAAGEAISEARAYAFVTGDAPPSVNPSLW